MSKIKPNKPHTYHTYFSGDKQFSDKKLPLWAKVGMVALATITLVGLSLITSGTIATHGQKDIFLQAKLFTEAHHLAPASAVALLTISIGTYGMYKIHQKEKTASFFLKVKDCFDSDTSEKIRAKRFDSDDKSIQEIMKERTQAVFGENTSVVLIKETIHPVQTQTKHLGADEVYSVSTQDIESTWAVSTPDSKTFTLKMTELLNPDNQTETISVNCMGNEIKSILI